MCKCIDEITELTQKHVKEKIEGKYKSVKWIDEGSFKHIGWNLHGGPSLIAMPFEYKFRTIKKDGTEAKNATTNYVAIYPSFCPFCGEEIKIKKS